jgi:hypothetical protein
MWRKLRDLGIGISVGIGGGQEKVVVREGFLYDDL